MIDVSKLNRWRRADLEAALYKGIPLPGDIAGDIVLGPRSSARSIRFSFNQHEFPDCGVVLSAQGHTKCTDVDVARFMRFARLRIIREVFTSDVKFVRAFDVVAR